MAVIHQAPHSDTGVGRKATQIKLQFLMPW